MKRVVILVACFACGPKPTTPVSTPPAPAPAPVVEAAPEPTPPPVAAITFSIEDSFDISGRGPVAMGRLKGHLEVGDELVIEGSDPPLVVEVLAIELLSDRSGTPTPDTPAGLLLRLPAGSDREAVLVRGATLVRAP